MRTLLILITASFLCSHVSEAAQQAVPDNLAAHPAPAQPIAFSHKRHVSAGLHCDGCHANPDPGQQMGLPATRICVGCHVAVASDEPDIAKLTEYSRTNQPIDWVRVYRLTSEVNWSHRDHLRAGVQCAACHGPVADLDHMAQLTSVTTMASCISCHEARHARRECNVCHNWPAEAIQVPARAGSPPLTKLDVVLFPSAAAAAIYVGLDRGDYARAGLDVSITETPDSSFLISNLVNGRFQVAVALADNFIAYQQGQHATAHLPGRDVSMIMGLTKSTATLVARPDFTTVESLRNRRLGVDAPGTGLAFVLYRMLENAGLSRDDYTVVRAGSTQERARALIRGEIDATMLTPEFARQAQADGMRTLAESNALVPSYMGATVAIERNWATQSGPTIEAFISATLAATRWLTRAENEPALTQLLSRHLQIPPEQLRQSLAELIEGHSLIRDGRVDLSGLEAVLALRARYGRPAYPSAAPGDFLDPNYLDSALRRASAQH